MAGNGLEIPDLFGYAPEIEPENGDQHSFEKISRYSEFLICAWLSRMGHGVIHENAAGYDIVLHYNNTGRPWLVDVKSSAQIDDRSSKRSSYVLWRVSKNTTKTINGVRRSGRGRHLDEADCDILALFYRPLETVFFHPVLEPLHTIRLPVAVMRTSGDGKGSLDAAISKLSQRLNRQKDLL